VNTKQRETNLVRVKQPLVGEKRCVTRTAAVDSTCKVLIVRDVKKK